MRASHPFSTRWISGSAADRSRTTFPYSGSRSRNDSGIIANRSGGIPYSIYQKFNQGDIDAALAGFEGAREIVRVSCLNIPAYNLDLYHARTLLMKGDYQGAIDCSAAKALVMRDEDAAAVMKDAYIELHGNEKDFTEYSAKLHRDVAVKVDDFELPDYDGKRHSFSGLKGAVTFIAFWSPT
jgi:hypothetical protein